MYFYGPPSADGADDDGGPFGNPVRRLVGPGADWWVEELACCLCGCLSTGPMFIIVGMLFLMTAATDPRRDGIRQYNRDVSAWRQAPGGGLAQLDALFPGDVSVFMSSLPTGGPTGNAVAYTTTLSLPPQTAVTPLADNGTAISSYSTSLWFEGDLPAWGGAAGWPSGDEYATFRPVGADGAFFDDITLQLSECSNTRATAYGANCTQAGPGAGLAVPTAAPAPGNGSAAQRRLAQFGAGVQCVQFLRAVRVPSALALELVPPRGCETAGGPSCGGNWTVRAMPQGCGTTFVTAQALVSEATWLADLRSGSPPAWCSNWSTGELPRAAVPPPATLSLRSYYDPYSQAAVITGCSFNFGPTTSQYAAFAVNLVGFGFAVVTITGCCLVALVARGASQAAQRARAPGEAAPLSGAQGGYGSTGWYGGAGGRSFY